MKLHEEFKEYENLWEDVLDTDPEREAIAKFINRKVGVRTYILTNEKDLVDYFKARIKNIETRFDNHTKSVGYRQADAAFARERAFAIFNLKNSLIAQAEKLGIAHTPEVTTILNILNTNPMLRRSVADINRDFPFSPPSVGREYNNDPHSYPWDMPAWPTNKEGPKSVE